MTVKDREGKPASSSPHFVYTDPNEVEHHSFTPDELRREIEKNQRELPHKPWLRAVIELQERQLREMTR